MSTSLRSRACLALAGLVLASSFALMVVPGQTTRAEALGKGRYRVTASVFGVPADGLIGNQTSSGHVLARYDRLVALPACTESSCPWVPEGTGTEGQFGPQTSCAEADGLCWVEVTSLDTGGCTVAPVLDRGPLFVRDNWWDLREDRTYRLKRGLPAAEAARDGADLGFGRGKSDRGYDIENVYDYAAAIDLAGGSWVDLGLDIDQGVGDVEVRLLWQAGLTHDEACGGYGNATTTDRLNLRASPKGGAEVVTVIGGSQRVGITSGARNGFYPVVYNGRAGWASVNYLRPDGGNVGTPAGIVSERVNLRRGPSTADAIVRRLPAGTLALLTGQERNGFLSVSVAGVEGWVFADYLDTGSGGGSSDGGDGGGSAAARTVTTDRLSLRAGPSTSDEVLLVIPDGAAVTLTGKEQRGFFSLSYRGTKGWASGDYLSTVRRVTERLNLRSGPSTSAGVIVVMPAGARVALLGGEENGFVRVRYHGREGWAYATYLD